MRLTAPSLAGALGAFLLASLASADPPSTADPRPPLSPLCSPKHRLNAADFANKNEHAYVTALPIFTSDPDTGYGFGARGYLYEDGTRKDPLFACTPYFHRIFLQAYATTRGFQFHWLNYDVPRLAGSKYRVRAQLIYERNTNRNYFGLGSASLQPLRFPAASESFDSFADYEQRLRQVQPDGTTYSQYNTFFFERPAGLISLEYTFWDDTVRPLVGLGFSRATVREYTGEMVKAVSATGEDVDAPEAPTRLRTDCDAGRVLGCNGGWDNTLRFGLSYDTRDFEPDPKRGVFVDLSLELGTRAIGSDYDYARLLFSPRFYYSPIPEYADLVLAARGVFQFQTEGTPFFSMDVLPFTEDSRIGLGGVRTLRGYKQDRFVGRSLALVNAEIRWKFFQFRLLEQHFGLIAAPFIDYGRVFDDVGQVSLSDWRRAQGMGFRVAWNLATIVMFDYGFSSEDTAFYMNVSHIF